MVGSQDGQVRQLLPCCAPFQHSASLNRFFSSLFVAVFRFVDSIGIGANHFDFQAV